MNEAGQLNGLQRWLFKHLPVVLLAEPFEILIVLIATVDVVNLAIHELMGSDQLFIGYYYGRSGLWAWIGFIMLGNLLIVTGLALSANHDALTVRKAEMSGLIIYGIGFAFYGYTNLAIGLGRGGPVVFPLLNEGIVIGFVTACVVRIVTLATPFTALSVTRTERIKLIKAELR